MSWAGCIASQTVTQSGQLLCMLMHDHDRGLVSHSVAEACSAGCSDDLAYICGDICSEPWQTPVCENEECDCEGFGAALRDPRFTPAGIRSLHVHKACHRGSVPHHGLCPEAACNFEFQSRLGVEANDANCTIRAGLRSQETSPALTARALSLSHAVRSDSQEVCMQQGSAADTSAVFWWTRH